MGICQAHKMSDPYRMLQEYRNKKKKVGVTGHKAEEGDIGELLPLGGTSQVWNIIARARVPAELGQMGTAIFVAISEKTHGPLAISTTWTVVEYVGVASIGFYSSCFTPLRSCFLWRAGWTSDARD
jgi:hypothetical protein